MTGRAVPREVRLPDPDATVAFGRRLGAVLRAGDVVLLSGGLGAGKTTLTRGIAEGLCVRGPVTSPTFVLSRQHPSLVGGPPLVHVDAYRLTDLDPADAADQLDALDLDATLAESVTVVEWGAELGRRLSADTLEVELTGSGTRVARLLPRGPRWSAVGGSMALGALGALAALEGA